MAKKSRFKVVDTQTGKSASLPAFLDSLTELIRGNSLPEKYQGLIPDFMKQMIVKSPGKDN